MTMHSSKLSLKIFCILFLLSVVAIRNAWCESEYCSKIDFNRPQFTEFVKCINKFLPLFVIKDYTSTSSITPYRPTSEYFLSTAVEGFTCAESTKIYHLNSSSRIEAAVFLSFENPGAFFEVLVFDVDRNIPVFSWKNVSSTTWYTIKGKISREIKKARVRDICFHTMELNLLFHPILPNFIS